MDERKAFKHESFQDRASIADYLSAIQKGIEKGFLHFSHSGDELNIYPAELLYLEIKAKKKNDRVKVAVKIEWKEENPVDMEENSVLQINTAR